MRSADQYVAGRGRNPNHRILFLGVTANEFVRLANRDTFGDSRQGFQDAKIYRAVISSNANGGSRRAWYRMRLQAKRFDALAYGANLFSRGMRMNDNQHGVSVERCGSLKSSGCIGPQQTRRSAQFEDVLPPRIRFVVSSSSPA